MLRRRWVKVLLFLRVNFNEHIQLSVSPLCCCLQIINSEWRRADLISGSSRLFVSCFGFCCSPCPAFSMKVGFWNCGSRANWCTGSSRCTGQLISHFCWLLCNYTIGLPEDSKQKKKKIFRVCLRRLKQHAELKAAGWWSSRTRQVRSPAEAGIGAGLGMLGSSTVDLFK